VLTGAFITTLLATLALLLPLAFASASLRNHLQNKGSAHRATSAFTGMLTSTPVLLMEGVLLVGVVAVLIMSRISFAILAVGDNLTIIFALLLLAQLLVPMIAIVVFNKRRHDKEKESSSTIEEDVIL
jgi:cytochrome c biogenesis factor